MIKIKNSQEFYKYIYSFEKEVNIEKLIIINSGLANFRNNNYLIEDVLLLYSLSDIEMYHLKMFLTFYKNKGKKINIYYKKKLYPMDIMSRIQNNINDFDYLWTLYKKEYSKSKVDALNLLLVKSKRDECFLDNFYTIISKSLTKNTIPSEEYFKLLFEVGQIYSKNFKNSEKSDEVYNFLEGEENIYHNNVFRSAILNAKALNSFSNQNINKAILQERESLHYANKASDIESYLRTLLNLLRLLDLNKNKKAFKFYFNKLVRLYSDLTDESIKNPVGFYLVNYYFKMDSINSMRKVIFSIRPNNIKEYETLFGHWTKMIDCNYFNIHDLEFIIDMLQINYVNKFKHTISKHPSIRGSQIIKMKLKNLYKEKNFTFSEIQNN